MYLKIGLLRVPAATTPGSEIDLREVEHGRLKDPPGRKTGSGGDSLMSTVTN